MEHLKLEYENVKGFADLKENKQDLFIQVYKLHNSIQGEDYKKGWTPKSVELIEKEYQSSSFIILKREDLIKNLSKKYNREKIEQIFESLIELGNIIKMKDDVYIHKEAFDKAVSMIKEYIIDKGSITVGETRDILNTNRKMALAIIEELDERKITKRVEDKRFLS